MPEAFMAAIAADLAPHFETLKQASAAVAKERAEGIAQLSGGAVQASAEQLAAIESAVCAQLCEQLRERLRDVARVYAQNASNAPALA